MLNSLSRGPIALNLFERLLSLPGWCVIMLVWLALVVPAIRLRGIHYEEGTVIALARGAFEDGHWLVPHHYGMPFPERPIRMSWLMALFGLAFGRIDQTLARLLPVLSLLGGGHLVASLLRPRVSAAATLFGALCFMLSPFLLQKLVTAEPDAMLSVLLFSAFVVWWNGHERRSVTVLRWLAIGVILIAAAMTKGPQPVAYFTLGVGGFLVLRRQWREWPGFLLANAMAGVVIVVWYVAIYQPGYVEIWRAASRLNAFHGWRDYFLARADYVLKVAIEALPGLLLAVPSVAASLRPARRRSDDLRLALTCYALIVSAILAFWPGGGPRYAMPAVLAVAALAGLDYDAWRRLRPRLTNGAVALMAMFLGYALLVNWIVMPLRLALFQRSGIAAAKISGQMQSRPGALYTVFPSLNNNVLAYLAQPIHTISVKDFATVPAPTWAWISEDEAAQVRTLRPDLDVTLRVVIHHDTDADLYELTPKMR